MSAQEHLITVLLKVVLLAGVASIMTFIITYTSLAPWWRSRIGRTIVVKDILLVAAFIPSILSLFFRFNRFTSLAAAWVDIVLLGAITPVMLGRAVLWYRLAHEKAGALAAAATGGVPGQQPEEAGDDARC